MTFADLTASEVDLLFVLVALAAFVVGVVLLVRREFIGAVAAVVVGGLILLFAS